ncbi:MAG: efflux RND transporter periplasmic adaptor subunit [Candidatus Thiodiazotropha sp.]
MKHILLLLLVQIFLLSRPIQAQETFYEAITATQRETQIGFTRAYRRVVLSAELNGRVISVNGDVGDSLPDGQALACVDDTFINLELRANRVERSGLQVDRDYYRKEVARIRQLLQQNSSSQSQLDTAQRNLDKTESQIQALNVQAEVLDERLQRLCVVPPSGWRVIERNVEPGQWVNTGEPIGVAGDYRQLVVPFALSVDEYRALQVLQQTGIQVKLTETGQELPARLIRVSPAFDPASRKIALQLLLDEGLSEHRGGQRVALTLDVPARDGAVMVPQQALRQRYEQYWLKREDGSEIPVVYRGRESRPDGEWVRVAAPGIAPGDRFIPFTE